MGILRKNKGQNGKSTSSKSSRGKDIELKFDMVLAPVLCAIRQKISSKAGSFFIYKQQNTLSPPKLMTDFGKKFKN